MAGSNQGNTTNLEQLYFQRKKSCSGRIQTHTILWQAVCFKLILCIRYFKWVPNIECTRNVFRDLFDVQYRTTFDVQYRTTFDVRYRTSFDVRYRTSFNVRYRTSFDVRYRTTFDVRYQTSFDVRYRTSFNVRYRTSFDVRYRTTFDVRCSISDFVRCSILDFVRCSISDYVRCSISDFVRCSISDSFDVRYRTSFDVRVTYIQLCRSGCGYWVELATVPKDGLCSVPSRVGDWPRPPGPGWGDSRDSPPPPPPPLQGRESPPTHQVPHQPLSVSDQLLGGVVCGGWGGAEVTGFRGAGANYMRTILCIQICVYMGTT